MRKQFDIKYRPQIESGEYKVVTGDDRPVRIISWDKKVFGGRTEIVALVPTSQGDTEAVQLYCPNGTLIASNWNEKFRLFIVTPEPELTEFEKAVGLELFDEPFNEKHIKVIKEESAILLELAKKELDSEEGKAMLYVNEKAYKIGFRDGKAEGYEKAMKEFKELPALKWPREPLPAFWPPCHYGGECTNPFRDCINCPRGAITVVNTTTGTSTSKVEGK